MWEQFEARVTRSGQAKPMKAKDLAGIEKLAGTPLPPSYVVFMTRFGPGMLAGYFSMRGMVARKSGMSLPQLFELYRDNLDVYVDQFGQKALLKRILPFCDTIGGDIIGWDPGVPGKAAQGAAEFPVLMLPDGGKSVVRLADSFDRFVMDVALSKAFGDIVGDPDYQVDATYVAS